MRFISRNVCTGMILAAMMNAFACSHAPLRKAETPMANGPMPIPSSSVAPDSSAESFGPPAPSVQEDYGPTSRAKKAIVVVLGPGLARSLAGVGVLKALEEAHIPIAGIVATESGALVAALYSASASANELEWRLLQLKKDDFFKLRSGLSGWLSGDANTQALDRFIEKSFGAKEFREGRVPLRFLVSTVGRTPSFTTIDQGPVSKGVRAAMGVPGLIKTADWAGNPAASAALERSSPLDEARSFGSLPILVVDVVDKAAPINPGLAKDLVNYCNELPQSPFHHLDGATWIVKPDLSGLGYLDSDHSADAIFKGKKAAAAVIPKIREELQRE